MTAPIFSRVFFFLSLSVPVLVRVQGDLSLDFIHINYASPLFLPVSGCFFSHQPTTCSWQKIQMDICGTSSPPRRAIYVTAILGPSEQSTLHPPLSSPKHVRARHVSKATDPHHQTLNAISFPLDVKAKTGSRAWLDMHIDILTPEGPARLAVHCVLRCPPCGEPQDLPLAAFPDCHACWPRRETQPCRDQATRGPSTWHCPLALPAEQQRQAERRTHRRIGPLHNAAQVPR